jgi:two-component system, OmpR family, sensor histidine kinase CreC
VKIRTAIFGVYVAASALGFAVLMAFILKEVRPRYVESMRRTLGDTAALLAVLLEADLQKKPAADLAETWRGNLGALERASGGLRVYVTDTRGIVAFDSAGGADVGRDYTRRPEMALYFKSKYETADNVDLVNGELRVTAAVRREGTTVGRVGVARSLNSVTEAIMRARLRLIAGGLAVAALMTAAGWWIAAKLTGSLERLTAYAVAVRDGKEAKPPVSRASEVAALAKAFEEMRVALEGKAYVERYTQALAHEVKAPLSAIRGAAELLQEDLPAEERARFLAHLRTESGRIEQIVERMLRLAALEARRGLEEAECVEPGAVAREAVDALRPVWVARGVEVRVVEAGAAAGGGLRVKGEVFLLVQAVVNLVQNAVEFSPAGGVVTVSVERGDADGRSLARVVVDDAGPGVPEFAWERIFERFYSLPRPEGGRKSTGLGLSFVREIAALHGGTVTVENRAGGGTRAVLGLPAV